MTRKLLTLLTAGAVSATALAGGAAFAKNDGGDQAEVQAFLSASQDITAAIGAAEAAGGGTAVAAEFGQSKGTAFYEVDTIAKGKQVSVEIDASTGKVIQTKDEGDGDKAEKEDITDPAQLGAPLAQLVAMAEKSGGGKVMAISADHDNAKSGVIEVELAKSAGTTQDFAMAADGTMTKVVANQDEDQDGQDEDAD